MKKMFWQIAVLLCSVLIACGSPAPAPSVLGVDITTGETQVLSAGSTLVFASVDGTNGASNLVNWTATAGTFSSSKGISSRFTAPAVTTSTPVTITATSVQDSSKKATSIITVLPPPPAASSVNTVAASATSTNLAAAASTNLSSNVTGTGGFSNAVNWSIISGTGTLSSGTGTAVSYTAPSLSSASITIIRATSVQDPSKSDTVQINNAALPPAATITGVNASAVSSNLAAAASTNLSSIVNGTGAFSSNVLWSIVSGTGSLNAVTGATVSFTAPSLNIASATIIRASSAQDPSQSATVVINVAALPPSATITGISASATPNTVTSNGSSALSAIVTGTGAFSSNVLWSIVSGGGSLDAVTGASVTLTAPSVTSSGSVIIRVSSAQDPSQSTTVSVKVNPPPTINNLVITATKVALRESDQSFLQAIVTGSGAFDPGVTWNIENNIGSFSNTTSNNVLYTAPITSTLRIVRVTATSTQDLNVKKTIYLSVNPARNTIVAGLSHSLALRSNDTILSWGRNSDGQLGNGSSGVNNNQSQPVTVIGANGVTAIAAGAGHSLALKSDSTLLSWGRDSAGQLGDGGTNTNQSIAVAVSNITTSTGVITIAAGAGHSLALKSDGTLLSWGSDSNGQLGNGGTNTSQSTPITVSGADGIVALAAGYAHSLALKSDGTLVSWGSDSNGQLGDGGTNTDQSTPVIVSGASEIVAIAASENNSLALKSDGTMLAWGSDVSGQLGDGGTNTDQSTPVIVSGASEIVAVAAGYAHSLALKSDGTMLAWGSDVSGQLGDNAALTDKSTPVLVSGASGIVAIAAGGFHSLALKSDGTLLSWGSDTNSQLGDGGTNTDQPTPVSVLLGSSLIRLP